MLSMMRANFYRLARTRGSWVALLAFALTIVLAAVVAFYLVGHSVPEFVSEYFGPGLLTPYSLFGETLLSGGLVGLFAVGTCEVFVFHDFEKGFVKNLLQIRGGRPSYIAAALPTMAVACAVFLLVGMLVTGVSFWVVGFGGLIVPVPASDLAIWFVQALLVTLAYATIVLFVVVLTRSGVCGSVAFILLPSGAVESVLQMAFANLFPNTPALRDCMDGSLSVLYAMLASGPVEGPQLWVTAGTVIVVAFAASLVAMSRIEIK